MNKRDFIKTALVSGIGMASFKSFAKIPKTKESIKNKHWAWDSAHDDDSENKLLDKYTAFFEAGIRGVFFEHDSEKHFRIAKKAGLETHRWMWTMNRGDEKLLKKHPEIYAVSRSGKSCATDQPYVKYYHWLCPSQAKTKEYLSSCVKDILKKDYVDGIHLDYVRYCDVILPVNLWDKYGIEQTKELPDYDFCYCETCREKYKNSYGIDPLEIEYPSQSPSWRKFRYSQLNTIVNHLAEVAHSYNKPITAAVFPTPEIARRIVRQDWTNWNLDGVCPMIYNAFYRENIPWIGDAVEEGIHLSCNKFPLYAGLFLPDIKTSDELEQSIRVALQNGASGVSLFGDITSKELQILKKFAD